LTKKITELTEDTSPASGDYIETVDVSDTTDDPSGSSKKVKLSNLAGGNPFNQSLDTTDTPSFTGLGLTDDLDLNDNNITKIKSLTRIETAGESLVAGNVCYLKSDGKYWKADSSVDTTCNTDILLCNATISADATGEFIELGEYTTTSLTAGSIYYISETAGAYTSTAPTTSTSIVRIVGYARSTTVLVFKPDITFVEVP